MSGSPSYHPDEGAFAPALLELDAETQSDLNLFEPEGDSLFAFCDHCRTDSGRRVLRRRMLAPSADAQQIRGTQQAIETINSQREAFNHLPSEYVGLNTERYITAGYPVVRQQGAVEFHLAAYAFWRGDDQFFTKIVRGESVTRRFLDAMRRLCAALNLPPAAKTGELEPLLSELRELLARPGVQAVQVDVEPRFYWQKLRVDQLLRHAEKASLARMLELAAQIDALVSMADVVRKNALVMPELLEGELRVEAEGLVHPLLSDAVANPIALSSSSRLLFLTGPNMAGKTTYLRTFATALYFAHLGLGVPATRFRFVPVERLLTGISLRDDLSQGISYFRAEALRMRSIAEAVGGGYRTVAVLDEPFKGTNVKDAFDATVAVLERLAEASNGLFVVTSHLIEVSERLERNPCVAFGYFEANEASSPLTFDFVLQQGVSSQRLGMRVLKEEGVFDLLGDPPA